MNQISFEQFYYLDEASMKDYIKMGALGAAAMLGNPDSSEGAFVSSSPNEIRSQQSNHQVLNRESFVKLWAVNYQTSNDSSKKDRVRKLMYSERISLRRDVLDSIEIAINIFDGDMGVSKETLRPLMIFTGYVESDYKHLKQLGNGPARGYWQVEPQTAIDIILNARSLLGPKFRNQFSHHMDLINSIKKDTPENRKKIGDAMLEDMDLAAAFAAATWVRQGTKGGDRDIRNYDVRNFMINDK